MSPEPAVSQQLPRGRPRDPAFEERVFEAAVSLYAHGGLDSLSMGAIARRARVGKASLYMRWPDKVELLRDALEARIVLDTDLDTGDFRADLRRLAGQMLDMLATEAGLAFMRRIVDATARPDVPLRPEGGNPIVLAARQLVHNAVDRGDLPEDASPTVVMDMLFGAAMMHASVTPPLLRSQERAGRERYLDQLTESVIAGASRRAASVTESDPDARIG
ncbi:transcriptional regulator, TetR family [Nocardia nova SH22a]|uniref:Transcriptional regulator, TetR family n=1 Tax=Nocardia nova SH22a TaxID=1415166 RepID=W5TLH8_9NOCA|nr:TetR/AcrR family transcriptional regulator [Nocardia nova]AHH19989.1 transcriptional regulator, TetR family [Nocardia nova SH22a]